MFADFKWFQLMGNAMQSLLLHKLRSSLSVIGIIFAVVSIISMLAIGEGAKQETLEQIRRLGTRTLIIKSNPLTENPGLTSSFIISQGLDREDLESLKKSIPHIACIGALKEVPVLINGAAKKEPISIFALTASYGKIKNFPMRKGRFLCRADEDLKNQVCVIGAGTAIVLGKKGGLGWLVRIKNNLYMIVGILKKREEKENNIQALSLYNFNQSLIMPMGTEPMVSVFQEKPGSVSEILIQMEHMEDIAPSAKLAGRILLKNRIGRNDFQIVVPQELMNQARRSRRVFNLVLGCIAGISLVVGGIGIMNIMLSGVAERTREIGIRRAVGANRIHIAAQFLFEAILLTFVGGFTGLLFGIGAASLISITAKWPTILTFWSMASSISMALIVGIISGLYPAIRASRLDPAAALRNE